MVWAVINPAIGKAIEEFADSTSHRIVAVVGGAVVEESLRRALETRLRFGDDSEKFFDPINGPLGPFAAKVRLGYLLHMYDEPERDCLNAIVRIRNIFAHRLDVTSLDQDNGELRKATAKLILQTRYNHYPHPFHDGNSERVEAPADMRETLIINMRICMVLLMRDLKLHQAYTNIFTPLPRAPS